MGMGVECYIATHSTPFHIAACINDIANATAVSCTGPTDQQAIACIANYHVSSGICSGVCLLFTFSLLTAPNIADENDVFVPMECAAQ
jgi:hypothetical protein